MRGVALLLAALALGAGAVGCAAAGPVGAARIVCHSSGGKGKHYGEAIGANTMAFVNRGHAGLVDEFGELRRSHAALKVIPDDLMADLLANLAGEGFAGYAEAGDPGGALARGARAFIAVERDGTWRTFVRPPRPVTTSDARARDTAFGAMANGLMEVFSERTQFFVPGGRNALAEAWSAP